MDHLLHDPKRACVILMAVFLLTMITGEFIGAARRAVPSTEGAGAVEAAGTAESYFELDEILDLGPVNLTPVPDMG